MAVPIIATAKLGYTDTGQYLGWGMNGLSLRTPGLVTDPVFRCGPPFLVLEASFGSYRHDVLDWSDARISYPEHKNTKDAFSIINIVPLGHMLWIFNFHHEYYEKSQEEKSPMDLKNLLFDVLPNLQERSQLYLLKGNVCVCVKVACLACDVQTNLSH
ncbi:hypothetical protein AVEN_23721-1 [Araneus ventricosus]|uniref:Uncharacterized protein n=1 Tax=Araneus ventricosus TaxID=182803 RepID=A0A4Y2TQG1_ARAVE|nr:hypothetical protein AVEN_23721-1 [Araneus ventricosus]